MIRCFCQLGVSILLLMELARADRNEKQLIKDLLTGYDKRLKPSVNASQVLNVTFGLSLAQLIDVDEKNQIVTTNCWLNQMWLDHELSWDPKDYGGIKNILLPYDSIWLPDILLYNNADVASLRTSAVSTNVMVSHTGNVTWLSTVIYRSSCTMNVRYFPFDTQNCSMIFASWTYDGSKLNLMLVNGEGDLSNYVENSEFTLLSLGVAKHTVFYSCCPQPYPDITYYIHIRRRPMFYVFNMLLPCCLITLVALLGFYIPSDSGEKVTMGITTLLSMTVFLMLVTEAMPPTADHLPLIGIYYFTTIGIVSLATAMTVCTLNIHHKGTRGKLVPPWIEFVCFKILAKIFCIPIEYPDPDLIKEEPYTHKRASSVKFPPVHHPISRSKSKSPFQSDSYELQELLLSPSGSCGKFTDHEYSMETTPPLARAKPAETNGRVGSRCPKNYTKSPPKNGRETKNDWQRVEQGNNHVNNMNRLDNHFSLVLQNISESILQNELRLVEQDRRDAIKLQWQQVAVVVDRLLMFVFVTLTIGITLGLTLKGII